jgi:hypothetical protein
VSGERRTQKGVLVVSSLTARSRPLPGEYYRDGRERCRFGKSHVANPLVQFLTKKGCYKPHRGQQGKAQRPSATPGMPLLGLTTPSAARHPKRRARTRRWLKNSR